MVDSVTAILCNLLSVEESEARTSRMGLSPEWNSLTHMEIVVEVSSKFALGRLSVDEITSLTSYEEVVGFVCRKLGIGAEN